MYLGHLSQVFYLPFVAFPSPPNPIFCHLMWVLQINTGSFPNLKQVDFVPKPTHTFTTMSLRYLKFQRTCYKILYKCTSLTFFLVIGLSSCRQCVFLEKLNFFGVMGVCFLDNALSARWAFGSMGNFLD